MSPGPRDRDAVGDRRHHRQRDRVADGQRAGERRGALGLYADDADVGVVRLHATGDAGGEPAAADRHDHCPDVGHGLDDLEADGALAGHDVGWSNGWMKTLPCSSACAFARPAPRRRSGRG
jgi:hypothetical protein